MRPLIIDCGSVVNLRFLLKWLKDGGYGTFDPIFQSYVDRSPGYYHVIVTKNGVRVNTRPSLESACHLCDELGERLPIVYSEVGVFLTSHRNVSIDGTSRVHAFLPSPTV